MIVLLLSVVLGDAWAGAPAKPAIVDQVCVACHSIGGQGGNVGPAFDGVGSRRTAPDLDRWLKDPQAYKPGTAMPKIDMTDAQRQELVAWLSSLK